MCYDSGMIKLKCSAEHTCCLTKMTPFQGNLKVRSKKDLDALYESLVTDGLLMPFALWPSEDKLYILDGHGRYQAMVNAALNDISVLEQEFPYIRIDAETEEDARKALLQIVSTYGRINKDGVVHFAAPVIGYKAPIIKTRNTVVKHEVSESKEQIIRLRVPKDKADDLKKLLKTVDWVEVY